MTTSERYKNIIDIICQQDGTKKFFLFVAYEYEDENFRGIRTDDLAINFSNLEIKGLHYVINEHLNKKSELKCYDNKQIQNNMPETKNIQ